MAEQLSLNCVTKFAIVVVSLVLAVLIAINLISLILDGKSFGDINKIIGLVKLGIGLTLCVLSFWGAYSENACLCYVALSFCILLLILAVINVLYCLLEDEKCTPWEYTVRGSMVGVTVLMIVLVFLFIRSIQ